MVACVHLMHRTFICHRFIASIFVSTYLLHALVDAQTLCSNLLPCLNKEVCDQGVCVPILFDPCMIDNDCLNMLGTNNRICIEGFCRKRHPAIQNKCVGHSDCSYGAYCDQVATSYGECARFASTLSLLTGLAPAAQSVQTLSCPTNMSRVRDDETLVIISTLTVPPTAMEYNEMTCVPNLPSSTNFGCSSSMCNERGQCVVEVSDNTFNCICHAPFYGNRCEQSAIVGCDPQSIHRTCGTAQRGICIFAPSASLSHEQMKSNVTLANDMGDTTDQDADQIICICPHVHSLHMTALHNATSRLIAPASTRNAHWAYNCDQYDLTPIGYDAEWVLVKHIPTERIIPVLGLRASRRVQVRHEVNGEYRMLVPRDDPTVNTLRELTGLVVSRQAFHSRIRSDQHPSVNQYDMPVVQCRLCWSRLNKLDNLSQSNITTANIAEPTPTSISWHLRRVQPFEFCALNLIILHAFEHVPVWRSLCARRTCTVTTSASEVVLGARAHRTIRLNSTRMYDDEQQRVTFDGRNRIVVFPIPDASQANNISMIPIGIDARSGHVCVLPSTLSRYFASGTLYDPLLHSYEAMASDIPVSTKDVQLQLASVPTFDAHIGDGRRICPTTLDMLLHAITRGIDAPQDTWLSTSDCGSGSRDDGAEMQQCHIRLPLVSTPLTVLPRWTYMSSKQQSAYGSSPCRSSAQAPFNVVTNSTYDTETAMHITTLTITYANDNANMSSFSYNTTCINQSHSIGASTEYNTSTVDHEHVSNISDAAAQNDYESTSATTIDPLIEAQYLSALGADEVEDIHAHNRVHRTIVLFIAPSIIYQYAKQMISGQNAIARNNIGQCRMMVSRTDAFSKACTMGGGTAWQSVKRLYTNHSFHATTYYIDRQRECACPSERSGPVCQCNARQYWQTGTGCVDTVCTLDDLPVLSANQISDDMQPVCVRSYPLFDTPQHHVVRCVHNYGQVETSVKDTCHCSNDHFWNDIKCMPSLICGLTTSQNDTTDNASTSALRCNATQDTICIAASMHRRQAGAFDNFCTCLWDNMTDVADLFLSCPLRNLSTPNQHAPKPSTEINMSSYQVVANARPHLATRLQRQHGHPVVTYMCSASKMVYNHYTHQCQTQVCIVSASDEISTCSDAGVCSMILPQNLHSMQVYGMNECLCSPHTSGPTCQCHVSQTWNMTSEECECLSGTTWEASSTTCICDVGFQWNWENSSCVLADISFGNETTTSVFDQPRMNSTCNHNNTNVTCKRDGTSRQELGASTASSSVFNETYHDAVIQPSSNVSSSSRNESSSPVILTSDNSSFYNTSASNEFNRSQLTPHSIGNYTDGGDPKSQAHQDSWHVAEPGERKYPRNEQDPSNTTNMSTSQSSTLVATNNATRDSISHESETYPFIEHPPYFPATTPNANQVPVASEENDNDLTNTTSLSTNTTKKKSNTNNHEKNQTTAKLNTTSPVNKISRHLKDLTSYLTFPPVLIALIGLTYWFVISYRASRSAVHQYDSLPLSEPNERRVHGRPYDYPVHSVEHSSLFSE
jgi:hypothetical protein